MAGLEQVAHTRGIVLIHLATMGLDVELSGQVLSQPTGFLAADYTDKVLINIGQFPCSVLIFAPRTGQYLSHMSQPIYKVIFHNQNRVYEVYARQIFQSDMWGFIEVEEFLFGERSQLLVDPSEEKLKNEFQGVKRSYLPIGAIIRIDEVEKEGAAKIREASGAGNISSFPMPGMVPGSNGADE